MRNLLVVAAAAVAAAAAFAAPAAVDAAPLSHRNNKKNKVHHGIFSRRHPNRPFGITAAHPPARSSATHVEVMETPSPVIDDKKRNELGRYLSVRGGYDENVHESAEWDSCTAYSAVGIINLLPPDNQGDVGRNLAQHLEEELLPSLPSHVENNDGPMIICLPNDSETSALVGNFAGHSDERTSETTLASYETIGTVSDTIYILVQEGDGENNEASIDGIASVLKGLARKIVGESDNGPKPRLVIYIQTPGANHQSYVRYLLQAALAKLQEDNSESKWESMPALQGDVDIVALPYKAETVAKMAATGGIFASHSQSDAPKAVPMSSFEALATQLYRALSRSAAAAIEFYAVSSVSASVESDDETMSGPEAFAKDDRVGESDDVYNDDASSELENEAPVEDDDISVETESIDGTEPAPLDVPNEPARQMMLSELTGASRRILLECERKMGDLEAKQDEFLLNSDQGMPILEFGSDAQAIIDYAAASFEEKAEDATGTEEIDDSIQRQIEGEMIGSVMRSKLYPAALTHTNYFVRKSLNHPKEMKMSLLVDVAGDSGLRHLFELQLQSLREYYGRRYEAVLDEILGSVSEGGDTRSKEKQEAILTAAAQRAAEGFRTAAGNAMPLSCRNGGVLENLDFGIVITRDLNGLMQDMIEATQSRQELEEDWDNAATGEAEAQNTYEEGFVANNGGNETRRQRKGPAKWYEKISARALVLGVNYLQGWLALQQLRKAAADRDRVMPKFPLF